MEKSRLDSQQIDDALIFGQGLSYCAQITDSPNESTNANIYESWLGSISSPLYSPNCTLPDMTLALSSPGVADLSSSPDRLFRHENMNNTVFSPSIFSPLKTSFSREQEAQKFNDFDNNLKVMMLQPPLISTSEKINPNQQISSANICMVTELKDIPVSSSSPPDRPEVCNCKKTRCLKLYCECFQAQRYCYSCNCFDCYNILEHESSRREAMKLVNERSSKIIKSKASEEVGSSVGCNCKQSRCLKKYCECFLASAFCGSHCKCKSCSNYSGSTELNHVRSMLDRSTSKRKKESPTSVSFIHSSSPNFACNLPMMNQYNQRISSSTSRYNSENNYPHNYLVSSFAAVNSFPGNICDGKFQNKFSVSFASTSNMPVQQFQEIQPLKKRKIKEFYNLIVYSFFGCQNPSTPKVIALRCLEFLDDRDFWAMASVNTLWYKAAMDDALWSD